jgi:hypothetical protein
MTLDPAELDTAIRDGDDGRVRELLRHATEPDRRAAAKALAHLFAGPGFPLPQPVVFTSLTEGAGFMFRQMARSMAGNPEEPNPAQRAFDSWREISNRSAFVAAAVGVAGGIGVATKALDAYHNFWDRPAELYDVIAAVLADRNPPWLPDLVSRRLTQRFTPGVAAWPLARRLVRLGVVGRPDIPEYTTLMPAWVCDGMHDDRSVLAALRADPGLLDEEVWRIFTVPGTEPQLRSLTSTRNWPRDTTQESAWTYALATLADEGTLDRGRLLDACLDAFVRDFPANQVGWYLEFHDRLSPQPDEMTARSAKYLALLAAPGKTAVTLGQRACGALLDAGRLDVTAFLTASPPALVFPQKSVALSQLKLLGKLATRDKSARPQALAAAAEAFTHPREDVQQAALKLIAKHGVPAEPASRAAITALATSLSPVLTPDALDLGIITPRTPTTTLAPPAALTSIPELAPPAAPASLSTLARSTAPALSTTLAPPAESVTPITDPAELIQLFAQLIEDASDAIAVERAIAGAVRLVSLPLADRARLAGPLLKRAETQAAEDWDGPFTGHLIRADLAQLGHAWATGERPQIRRREKSWMPFAVPDEVSKSGEARTMSGILTARIYEACKLVAAGRPATLLAEPEFTDGTISHSTLLARLPAAAVAFSAGVAGRARRRRHDLGVALLRLAPGVQDEFWAEWGRIDDHTAAEARHVYLASTPQLDFVAEARRVYPESAQLYFDMHADGPIMPYVSARIAPLDSETPAGGQNPHQVPAPATGRDSVDHCWRLLTDLTSRALLEHGRRGLAGRYGRVRWDELVAAWPLLAPHHPELIAAHLLRPLSDGLEPGRSAATTAVSVLAQPGREFGNIGHLALVTAMASAEPDTRIAAASAWTRIAQDGRLNPALAARAITKGVTSTTFKINRVAESLSYAATDPLAASSVAQAAMLATAELLPAKPTNLHLLLEQSARAAATGLAATGSAFVSEPASVTGLPQAAIPSAITALAASSARTKLAEAARLLTRLA